MFIVELINTTLVELIPIRYSELVPHYCLNIIAVDEMLFQGLFLTDRLEYFKRFKYKKMCFKKIQKFGTQFPADSVKELAVPAFK